MITLLVLLLVGERIASFTGLEFAFFVWLREKIKRTSKHPLPDSEEIEESTVVSQISENKTVEEKIPDESLVD